MEVTELERRKSMEADGARRPDLLLLVAIWEFITAFLALVGIGAIGLFAFPAVGLADVPGRVGAFFGLGVGVVILLAYMALAVMGGIGILGRKDWGRVLSIAHGAVTLLWIPIGTVIGVLQIIYLSSPDVRRYFGGPSRT